MTSITTESKMYLGRLVPPPSNQGLSKEASSEIKAHLQADEMQGRKIEVLVTSTNALKKQAALASVEAWVKTMLKVCDITVRGFGSPSNIDEQPHGEDNTRLGATNRLNNLKIELLTKENLISETNDGTLRVLISLENGLMKENIITSNDSDDFKEVFQNDDRSVWVDRCIEVGEIWFAGRSWAFSAISEGVTTPRKQVEESEKTNWRTTAGTFIELAYGWPSKDWHGGIAGKGRQIIMEELSRTALGLPISAQTQPETAS